MILPILLLLVVCHHAALAVSGDGDETADVFGNKEDNVVKDKLGPTPKLFEGDIVLSDKQRAVVEKAIRTGNDIEDIDQHTYGASSTAYRRWPNGVIYYTFHSSIAYNRQVTGAIYAAMNEWKSKTCIRFQRRTNQKQYLEFFRGTGCWGYIGMGPGKVQISVGPGCEYRHVMTHEIGHVVGFWHEQSRTDRDSYVRIMWSNVPSGLREAFAKYGRDKVNSLGVPYDYGSIMHYPWNAFSTNGRNTLQPIRRVDRQPYQTLSDKDALQTNRMYGCAKKPVTKRPQPPKPETEPPVPPKPPTERPVPTPRPTKRPITECKYVEVIVPVRPRVRASCRTNVNQCRRWANRGECNRNPAYMNLNCACVCGRRRTVCRDTYRNCRGWARTGECRRNPRYMLVYCKKSCNRCGPTTTKKIVKKCYTVAPPDTEPPSPPPPSPPVPTPPVPSPPVPSPPVPTPPVPTPPIPTPKPTRPKPKTPPPNTPPPINETTPIKPLPSDCDDPVPAGLSTFTIPDKQLSASSSYNRWHGPHQGRLDLRAGQTGGIGAWCAKTQDKKQYFQIDLGKVNVIKRVSTQGRPSKYDKHVKSYFVSYSDDGKTWSNYATPDNAWQIKEFTGNLDQISVTTNAFHPPIIARYLRIHPTVWRRMICLRAELFICESDGGSGSGDASGDEVHGDEEMADYFK